MSTLYENRHPGEFILSEASGQRSRDAVTIAAEQTVEPGMLLGKIAVVADVGVVAAANAGNTSGSGDIALADPAVSSKVKDGVYTVTCIEPGTDAGKFRVEDPGGKEIGIATVGVAFDKEVKFTINDATDFVAGDGFTITVAADDEDFQHVPFDQDGVDGSEIPVAAAIYGAATAAGETAEIAAIVRDAEINDWCIAWPEDIEAAEKADAIQALAQRGVIVRA